MTQIQYRHVDYSCIYTSIACTRVAFRQSISQRSRIKKDTVEPSVPTREFNLEAYATEDQSINQSINH